MLVRTERAKRGCARGGFWRGNLDQLGASQLSAVSKILHTRQGIADAKYSRLSYTVIDSAILLLAPIYTPIKAEPYAPILRLSCGAGLSTACGFRP